MTNIGLIKDMINVTGSNRILLRGNDTSKFKNFDREAYLHSGRYHKVPVYKQASAAYVMTLHDQLTADNARTNRLHRFILLMATALSTVLFSITLWARF